MQELRDKLLEEAEESSEQNGEVAKKWAHLFDIDVPQDLQAEIQEQQGLCQEILGSKDKLITHIRTELKQKDDEYVRTLKQQAEDIDLLLQYMCQQLENMQAAYRDELTESEAAFLQVSHTPKSKFTINFVYSLPSLCLLLCQMGQGPTDCWHDDWGIEGGVLRFFFEAMRQGLRFRLQGLGAFYLGFDVLGEAG